MALRFGGTGPTMPWRSCAARRAELLSSLETIECYSYLGHEIARTVLDLHLMHCHALKKEPDYADVTGDLTSGPDRLISEELLREMGIVRKRRAREGGGRLAQVCCLGPRGEDLRRWERLCLACVVKGDGLLRYSFPPPHPFNSARVARFWDELQRAIPRGDNGRARAG